MDKRQEAIEHVQTPYVFLTVDDAIPMPDCLDELVAEMEHGDWDALIARQIPFLLLTDIPKIN